MSERNYLVIRSTGNVANGCTCVQPVINVPLVLYRVTTDMDGNPIEVPAFPALRPTRLFYRSDFFGPFIRVITGQLTFDVIEFVPAEQTAESLMAMAGIPQPAK